MHTINVTTRPLKIIQITIPLTSIQLEFKAVYTAHNDYCHNTNYGTILMMTNVDQLIPNAKGKDLSREARVGLECIHVCQYMMCFQSLSPLIYL